MPTPTRRHLATARGVSRLAVDATTGVADLVQALHERIARTPTQLAGPLVGGAVSGVTGLVYASVRGVTRAVGGGIDASLAQVSALLAALPTATTPVAVAPVAASAASAQTIQSNQNDQGDPGVEGAIAASPGAARPRQPTREALRAALNGVLGDYLAQTANPLALPMILRCNGVALPATSADRMPDLAAPRPRLVVLVHGLCRNDLQWTSTDARGVSLDVGAELARALDASVLTLHYNSGLHISTNAQQFAAALETVVAAWPVAVEALTLVGHSMGGLIVRGAVHYGTPAGHTWPARLRALVTLGAPHHGAPLERGGHWIDRLLDATPYTAPFARLGRVRSAGITDLRYGSTRDEDWQGHERFAHAHDTRTPLPLPARVACYALAASTTAAPGESGVGAVAAAGEPADGAAVVVRPAPDDLHGLAGDGLVPVASALGRHANRRFVLAFAPDRQAIAWNCGHLEMLACPAVIAQLRRWIGADLS